MQEMWFQSLSQEDALEKGMASYPLQYSWLENPLDRGAWSAIVHEVSKSQTRLSDLHFYFCIYVCMYLYRYIYMKYVDVIVFLIALFIDKQANPLLSKGDQETTTWAINHIQLSLPCFLHKEDRGHLRML